MLAILAAHSVTYFVSLPTAIAFCSLPAVLASPDQEFGEDKVPLSVQDRCIGLNVDIHVAGGFAVFMALVLGMLHLAALVARMWEVVTCGKGGVIGTVERKQREGRRMDGVDSTIGESSARCSSVSCCIPGSRKSTTLSAGGPSTSTSISEEERIIGIRSVDATDEGAEGSARQCEV